MTIPVSLLCAHLVGDFFFQSDWMAQNKSKDWNALAVHVYVYGAPIGAWIGLTYGNAPGTGFLLILILLQHFVQDAITSRITTRLWFFRREDGIWEQASYAYPKHGRTICNPWTPIDGRRHWFFVAIGVDQFLHFVLLAWALQVWR